MSSGQPRTAASILASNTKPWTRATKPAPAAAAAADSKDKQKEDGHAAQPKGRGKAQKAQQQKAVEKPPPKLASNSMWVRPPAVAGTSAADSAPAPAATAAAPAGAASDKTARGGANPANTAAASSGSYAAAFRSAKTDAGAAAPAAAAGAAGSSTNSSSMSWRSGGTERPNLRVGRVTNDKASDTRVEKLQSEQRGESGPPSARSVGSNHSHHSQASSKSGRGKDSHGHSSHTQGQTAQHGQRSGPNTPARKQAQQRHGQKEKEQKEKEKEVKQPSGNGDKEEEEKKAEKEEEKEEKEVAVPQEVGHRLETPWTIYFDKKLKSAADFKHFEQNLRKLGTFGTFEDLWKAYAYMQAPDDLPNDYDVFMFRHNYIPAWETFPNGGCWIIKVLKKNGLINRMWEELVFACASEQFEEPNIAGIVLSTRHKEDVLSVWNRDNVKYPQLCFSIGQKLKDLLNLDDSTVVEYKSFAESLKDGSTFRHSKQYTYAALTSTSNTHSPEEADTQQQQAKAN